MFQKTTSVRCIQLQVLTDGLRELELQLDNLRIIRETESLIDRSYSVVVTPKFRQNVDG